MGPALLGDREAVGELYLSYAPALLAYLRHKGNSPEEAMELLQGFFEHLLETDGLGKYEKKGKFRSWLLRGLSNFATDVWRKGQAKKKGEGRIHARVGVDVEIGELEPIDSQLTPEQAYDRKWAISLLRRVLSKLAGEYADEDRSALFDAIKRFLPGGDASVKYEEISATLGMKPNTVAVMVKRLRERYTGLLWAEVADTVEPYQIEEEWLHLYEALRGARELGSVSRNP
ncbi:MAG: sigma-70 family RNA polymerase sigma factor [Verrucomicrobia bacterium]|nr:sigma-70 family RNA polymerase sigma factor [Verrucomicrobiota bacterium]MBI3868721.1 sigma-70 family RNA polymerase sigma factor [Verrucomicrobiota bacterium]